MRSKKAMTIGQAPGTILAFGLMVLIAAAVALAVHSMKATQCDYSYDATTDKCLNSTGGTGGDLGISYAYNISTDGLVGLDNFSGQVPTVGTILGVALIIVVVVGAFAYLSRGSGGGL